MFGIGPMELIVVAIIAIVVVGPQRLPEAMKKLGRLFVQLRRQTNEVRQSFNEVVRDAERDLELERIRQLKDQVDQMRDTSAIKSKIEESLDISADDITGNKKKEDIKAVEKPEHSSEYHESHYHEGEYSNTSEGFVDTETLLEKAKEIEEKALRPKTYTEEHDDECDDHDHDHSPSSKASETTKPEKP